MCSKKQEFVHLHCHSTYSIQDALPQPADLANACDDLGFPAIALTDHGRMSGTIELVSACRATKNNVKPIVGIEVYTCHDMYDKSAPPGRRKPKHNHLTLLAQNESGYKNLLAISSIAAEEGFYYNPRVDHKVLEAHSEGIIALSGCLASEVNQKLLEDDYHGAEKIVDWFKQVYGDRYFIELQYHGIEEQKRNLPHLIKLAKEFNLPIVATNDVHYVTKPQWQPHDVLIQIRGLKDEKSNTPNMKKKAYETRQFYLKSQEQMMNIFKNYPEAITNTMVINEMVEDYFKIDVPHMLPASTIPVDKDFDAFKLSTLPNHNANDAYLAYLAFKGLEKKGLSSNKTYVNRLKKELSQIWYMGVTDYFLIYNEIITYMKSNDIMYGVRGSAVGSLVNFCLEVCPVDPVRWTLLFERFLNPGRGTQYDLKFTSDGQDLGNKYRNDEATKIVKDKIKFIITNDPNAKKHSADIAKELWAIENQDLSSYYAEMIENNTRGKVNEPNSWAAYYLGICDDPPKGPLKIKQIATLPDIDTDIDDSKREQVIDWIKDRFGHDKVANICAWGTYGARAAVQNCLKTSDKFHSKYPDKPQDAIIRITATIPKKPPGITVDEAIEKSSDFAYWYSKFKDELDTAKELYGKISHMGVHAAGILISDKPIKESSPIEVSKGTTCSGYEWESAERVGLVKYDILGLDTYHMLNLCKQLVKQRHDHDIDLLSLDFEDKELFKLFKSGQTSTVFQFGSPGMRDSLKLIKASEMEDLIAVVSLYRPGPMDYIPDYARRKLGKESFSFSHELIEKHLGYTYGILIYQEQAMNLAKEMAGFTWTEVDKLRKAISKKSGKDFDTALALFKQRSIERDVSLSVVEEVIQLMKKFGGYAFNRCLTGNTKILNPVNGSTSTIKDLYDFGTNYHPSVPSIGDDLKFKNNSIQKVIYNGIKPVWTLTTDHNHTIEATDNHPLLTINGWKEIKDIAPGQYIAAPAMIPSHITNDNVSKSEIISIAHILSEGNTCHPSSIFIYNNQLDLLEDFSQHANTFPDTSCKITSRKKGGYVLTANTGNLRSKIKSGLYQWALGLNIIYKKAIHKFIPEKFMSMDLDSTALLLGRMWSGDGHIGRVNSARMSNPYYATSSLELAENVKFLLLKLGIYSILNVKKFKYKESYKLGYTISISGDTSLINFKKYIIPHIVGRKLSIDQFNDRNFDNNSTSLIPMDVIHIINKEISKSGLSKVAACKLANIPVRNFNRLKFGKKTGFRKSTILKLALALDSDELKNICNGEVEWVRVRDKFYSGDQPTYDLTISNNHNFVANNLVVHNSHAASYAISAYYTAHMRWYYPSEWLAACIEIKIDDDDALDKYISEAEACNLKVEYPDVNYSELTTSLTKDGDIILPITFCKGVGTLAKSVVENKPYSDFSDFLLRAHPHKTIVKALAAGNAFRSMDDIKDLEYSEIMELYESISKEIKRKPKASKARRNILDHISKSNDSGLPMVKKTNSAVSFFEDFND